jgi:hypothetical protein
VLDFQRLIWKQFNHHCKKVLLGLKKLGEGGRNGKNFLSLQGYWQGCWKLQYNLILESSYSKRHSNMKMLFLFRWKHIKPPKNYNHKYNFFTIFFFDNGTSHLGFYLFLSIFYYLNLI